MTRRVRFDLVIGRVVRDERGHKVGRVHDVRVEEAQGALTVVEYHLGGAALLEHWGMSVARLLGFLRDRNVLRIPWDRVDISDPERPRYLGDASELSRKNGR